MSIERIRWILTDVHERKFLTLPASEAANLRAAATGGAR